MRLNVIKNQNGITLITLIITIIILIIISGVAINLTLGENGLFEKAKDAKEQYEISGIREEIEIAILEIQSEKISKGETFTIDEILAELPNKINRIALNKEGNKINGSYKGYNFTINESMQLSIEGESMQIVINTKVKEYLGKNLNEKYTVKVELTLNAKETINQIKIENTNGSTTTEEVAGNTYNKELELELDKEYKINIEAENGAKTGKTIQISSITNISNVEQLVEFRDNVNAGLTYEGATVNLLNDIDLSKVCYKVDGTTANDVCWDPIGNSENFFKGIFNGNYKTIDNLYINTESDYQGLFGMVRNANISGIIIGKGSSVKAREGAAAIVGSAKYSTINNCGNNANVDASLYYAGGIVSTSEYNEISSCYNKGVISASSNSR